jgi:hypothetical protein
MITTTSRRRRIRFVMPLALLVTLVLLPAWLNGGPLFVTPALAQTQIIPITSPQSCVSERSGGVVLNFDDLPAATHAADSYVSLGVRFLDDATTTPLIYGNTAERTTVSSPNSLDNDADTLNPGSSGVPLTIVFTNPQSVVGFYMGNATIPVSATLRAYNSAGTLLGTVITSVVSNNVNHFYGVSDTLSTIRKVTLDYGQSGQSEEIDNLCFGNFQPPSPPPARSFSGRVLQSARLGSPTSLAGVLIALYGSNDQQSLGTQLGTSTSIKVTGQYSMTTSAQYLYYTLVEGAAPQGFCRLSAVAGMGGVALNKERIRYANPAPGVHGGNDFYNTSGALCNPVLPPPLTAAAFPFTVPVAQIPVITLPQSDLRATRIEVNQAIQNDSNTVPQVIAKKTVVRVYVASGSSLTINNVLVRLHIFLNGTEVVSTQTRTRAVPSPQRTNVDDSANFYLTVYSGANATVGFFAEVDPNNEVIESNESNNTFPAASTQNHTFSVRQSFTITYAPITYTYSGWGGPSTPSSRIHTAVDWLRSIYPVPNSAARSTVYYPYPGFSFSQNVDTHDADLIGKLNTRWFYSQWGLQSFSWLLGVDVGPSANQLYGWLPDGAYGGNGLSDPSWGGGNSHVAFGNDKPDKYRRTLAHEIGHNIAFCHNNRFIDTIGFDVLLSHTVKNTSYRDFMWPARREDEAWIDTTNYIRLFNRLAPGAPFPPGVSSCQTQSTAAQPNASIQQTGTLTGTHEFAFITGSVNPAGTQGTLNPIYRDVRETADLPASAGAQYCVVLLNTGKEVLAQNCFVPNFMNGDGETEVALASFGFPMLWNPATARIELRNGATVLAARNVSANPPVVSLTSPNGGQTFGANANIPISWTASDADHDPLTYSILYSPDGGASWIPAAEGLTTTTYLLPAAVVAGSQNAIIRVAASDGVNTGQDQSDAAFTVSKKPPQVYITNPTGGVVPPESAVPLEGLGIDLEDGNLADSDLKWSSSKDGALGSGASLIVAKLSPGLHTITLTGKDSDNNTVIASVQLYVGYRLYLPVTYK